MSTGVESFADIEKLGAIYPLAGSEWLFILLGLIFWIGCHFWRIATEKHEHEEIMKCAREKAQK